MTSNCALRLGFIVGERFVFYLICFSKENKEVYCFRPKAPAKMHFYEDESPKLVVDNRIEDLVNAYLIAPGNDKF